MEHLIYPVDSISSNLSIWLLLFISLNECIGYGYTHDIERTPVEVRTPHRSWFSPHAKGDLGIKVSPPGLEQLYLLSCLSSPRSASQRPHRLYFKISHSESWNFLKCSQNNLLVMLLLLRFQNESLPLRTKSTPWITPGLSIPGSCLSVQCHPPCVPLYCTCPFICPSPSTYSYCICKAQMYPESPETLPMMLYSTVA